MSFWGGTRNINPTADSVILSLHAICMVFISRHIRDHLCRIMFESYIYTYIYTYIYIVVVYLFVCLFVYVDSCI